MVIRPCKDALAFSIVAGEIGGHGEPLEVLGRQSFKVVGRRKLGKCGRPRAALKCRASIQQGRADRCDNGVAGWLRSSYNPGARFVVGAPCRHRYSNSRTAFMQGEPEGSHYIIRRT